MLTCASPSRDNGRLLQSTLRDYRLSKEMHEVKLAKFTNYSLNSKNAATTLDIVFIYSGSACTAQSILQDNKGGHAHLANDRNSLYYLSPTEKKRVCLTSFTR